MYETLVFLRRPSVDRLSVLWGSLTRLLLAFNYYNSELFTLLILRTDNTIYCSNVMVVNLVSWCRVTIGKCHVYITVPFEEYCYFSECFPSVGFSDLSYAYHLSSDWWFWFLEDCVYRNSFWGILLLFWICSICGFNVSPHIYHLSSDWWFWFLEECYGTNT